MSFLFGLPLQTFSQLSPGKLAKVHSQLEGNLNCTKCHTLGEKVENSKCLDCHIELQERIRINKGYHAHQEVRSKTCASCHNDHHGTEFKIIKFDEKSFDHAKTGYALTGKHAQVDCRQCHKPAFISSDKIRSKQFTYLGLETACVSCHSDIHRNSLSKDCASCHTTQSFVPASLFNHSRSAFPLKGKHQQTECKACHPIVTTDAKPFQKFKGINFQNCTNCHTDPHKKNLGIRCSDCHTENSFQTFSGGKTFNHNTTAFPLKGKHKGLQCNSCHSLSAKPEALFQDKVSVKTTDCIQCHKDPHQSKFGTNCSECHNENGFQSLQQSQKFDHNLTAFKLEGKHQSVDCKKCHTSKFTDPLPHQNCTDCHVDYHEGQFIKNNLNPDCNNCHSVYGFQSSEYSIEQHALSSFPLDGSHLATPCSSCHFSNLKWKFKNLGKNCENCHKDPHESYIDGKYTKDANCKSCHSTSEWKDIHFNHTLTGYALEGQHKLVACMDCHKLKDGEKGSKYSKFRYKNSDCTDCHLNIHGDQFVVEGKTHCKNCHDNNSWRPVLFDHDQTAFKLDGKHRNLECQACHKRDQGYPDRPIVYKLKNYQCADCHH